jgi:pyruvate dehydrogenase E2 component (dihydrolipoamide acetyltransferase)
MPVSITLPELTPSMETASVATWLKSVGDPVRKGEVLAEIESDKATIELESPAEGILAKIFVPAGTANVRVSSTLALLAVDGEDVSAVSEPIAPGIVAPVVDPSPGAPSAAQPRDAERVLASPLARRVAWNTGIDLSGLRGSGPGGRIVVRDVESAARTSKATTEVAPANEQKVSTSSADADVTRLFPKGSYSLVPHDNMRRVVAARLTASKQTVPHFYLTVDCAMERLVALRTECNAAAPLDNDGAATYKLSINDFVIKALAYSLRRVPDANVTWSPDALLKHEHCDIGIAVALQGGLITPVIRYAESKSLSTISVEMKALAARARARKLTPSEYQGGSAAISNLGMYGIKSFSAIVNPPHASILAVGASEKRPLVRDGELVVGEVMTVTLSTDHRAVDGAVGAALIDAFRTAIEAPMVLLV